MDTATKIGPVCVGLAKPLLAKLEQMRKENPDMSSFAKTPIPKDLPESHFIAPTLLLNAPTMSADELFGPVATLTRFTTHAEIVSMTHAAQSRLKGFVFGKDEAAVRKVTDAVECAWWDWNVFQMGTPGIKSVGFAGPSGCNDLTPDVFMYSRYIARPHNQ
ncbi:Aldehyde dehydrogenase [Thoreauomyces humboldtii]|nr:Aldehyde dehydrogenase [Thoreauomyces humboldtii]